MYFFTSAPTAVVPLSLRGSTVLCCQAVVPPLGSTTVSGFCFFCFFAEVGAVVSFPLARGFLPCGSTALAEVPPSVPARQFVLTVTGVAAVPRACTVVPHGRAVVPLGSKR